MVAYYYARKSVGVVILYTNGCYVDDIRVWTFSNLQENTNCIVFFQTKFRVLLFFLFYMYRFMYYVYKKCTHI